jgi:tetratricopeptide (TPR) repeat protein
MASKIYELVGNDMYKNQHFGAAHILFICLAFWSLDLCQGGQPQLSVTVQRAAIYTDLNALDSDAILPKGALVLAVGKADSSGQYRRVKTVLAGGNDGWVKIRNLVPAADAFIERKARALIGNQGVAAPAAGREHGVPLLIQFSDLPDIVQIYKEAATAYSENQKLPKENRIPEPYIARAEIWNLVGNYPDAVIDFVDGVHCARKQGRDPGVIEKYHNKIAMVLGKIKAMPQPIVPPLGKFNLAAVDSFGKGLHSLKAKQFSAARHHFNDAIRLDPDVPVYWYLRAVTNHRDGKELQARHDAVMGNLFERDLPSWKGRRIATALHGIQGLDRAWLESFRDGTAVQALYGS